jgi:uncharacterized phiE125 gp8 family phage protein
MSYKVSNRDTTTLPTALLPVAKTHMRVDFTDDDVLITSLIARAIGLYERKTALSLFDANFEWTPDDFDNVTDQGVLCPVQPLTQFTVADSESTDVTASYRLAGNQNGEAAGLYLQPVDATATIPDGLTCSAVSGYTDATELPPATLDSILRITAHLYANRESVSDLLLREADWWADDLLVGAWVPRV